MHLLLPWNPKVKSNTYGWVQFVTKRSWVGVLVLNNIINVEDEVFETMSTRSQCDNSQLY